MGITGDKCPLLYGFLLYLYKIDFTRVRKLTLWMAALLLSSMLEAQHDVSINGLLLTTGTIPLTENLDELDKLKSDHPQSLVNGRYHWVVEFYEVPDPLHRRQIEAMDIRLGDYLPHRCYLASLPQDISYGKLQQAGIRSVYILTAHDKLAPSLSGMDLPWWAITGSGEVSVYAHLPQNIPPTAAIDSLQRLGYTELHPIPSLSILQVTLPTNRLSALAGLGFVHYVEPISPPGENENDQSSTNQRSNFLNAPYASGHHFDGSGINIMLDDDGPVGNHLDYRNRSDQSQTSYTPVINDHGDHIAGILIGAGNRDPRYKGMAPGATLRVYNYTSDLLSGTGLMDFPNAYVNHGVVLTNTSQSDGCNAGYTAFSQLLDQQTVNHSSLLHVFSAGNSANLNCGYGAGTGWGTITGGSKMGKNILAVGNVTKNDQLSSSSSKGPGTDGRIKPEVVGTGINITSTTDNPGPNGYVMKSGTSMAAPGVAGVIAQLYDAHKQLYGSLPPSGLIKATVLNTCDDLGNAGPDFSYGYGRVNGRRAYNLLAANHFISGAITQGGVISHTITVPANVKELRILVYWHDVPASVLAGPSLVNDLDLVVNDPVSGTWNPWVLNSVPNASTLSQPAVRSADHLNNIEQVTITNPAAGNYQAVLSGFNIPQGPQTYYLVYEFLMDELTLTYPQGGESFVPGETERVRWDSYGNSGNFTLEYSTNQGGTWNIAASNISATQRYFDWSVPSVSSGDLRMRISRGSLNDISDTSFSIMGVPTGLQADTVCGTEVYLSWQPVANAVAYEVFAMGTYYMQSLGTTTAAGYRVTGVNTTLAQWYSVRAIGPNDAKGRRCLALEVAAGEVNCVISRDIALVRSEYPYAGNLPSCNPMDQVPVNLRLQNNGTLPITAFTIHCRVDNGPLISESFSGVLAGGADTVYRFSSTADISAPGTHTLQAWIVYTGDQDQRNDSLEFSFNVTGTSVLNLPLNQDMESFGLCSTSSNCENNSCLLGSGWNNLVNLTGDDIDWRVNSGNTPSQNTGPSQDFAPGTPAGRYLYLESSNCSGKEAILVSDCINLTNTATPYLRFAYSMLGESTGQLKLEILHQYQWKTLFEASGEQPGEWHTAIADLTPYAGEMVQLRFTGITGPGFTSDIAIDAITISEILANYSATPLGICKDSIVTFTDQSLGQVNAYSWNFGSGAIPQFANTPGPHSVRFVSAGMHTVSLLVAGPEGANAVTMPVTVYELPVADVLYNVNGSSVVFTNQSQFASSYFWDFGDGDTSTQAAPVHIYNANGNYVVLFHAENACWSDDTVFMVEITGIGVGGPDEINPVHIYPNPASEQVFVQFKDVPEGMVNLQLHDLSGRQVLETTIAPGNKKILTLPLTGCANGVYLLKISANGNSTTRRLVISR